MGQELRSGLAGWFWFQVSYEAAAKIVLHAGAASPEGLTVGGGATSKMEHSHTSFLACGPPHRTTLVYSQHGCRQSEGSKGEQGGNCRVLYGLVSEVTLSLLSHFCC